jgi:protein TonB
MASTFPPSAASTRPLPPLPPLARTGTRGDGLTPVQRRAMTGAILALHIALVYGLLQVQEVRDAAREVAPMFVDLIAPPAPPEPKLPPPPVPQPVPKRTLPMPAVVAAPSPAPSAFTVAEQPAPVVQAPAPPAIVAPPAPAPVVATPPRVIPASEVEYLERPAADYPRLSIRNNETGRVIVLVLIDERGLPQQVQVAKSSGFLRLDNSALTAVRQSRFKPPTENGRPVSGWTNVPFDFGLEK